MYNFTDDTDFVKNKDERPWCATDVILKVCDAHITLTEAHEGKIWYGGTRRKQKIRDGKLIDLQLGRASEADAEQQAINAQRVQKRRNTMVRDLMNCNEGDLKVFDTLTGTGDYRNVNRAKNDLKNYLPRLERFIRTGKLYGRPVIDFTPIPAFELKVLGVLEFQDGKRREDGKGTGNVHFHHFQNTPYLPQVHVIHANLRDPKTLEWSEMYLNRRKHIGLYWSKVAGKDTIWCNTVQETMTFLKDHKRELPGLYFNAEPKKLCVNALLWGKGHTKIKKLQDLRKQGKLSNPGEYLCQYLGEDSIDERLRNHRGWYKYGELDRPEIYRDPGIVEDMIRILNLWDYFTHKLEFVAEYLGAMTKYYFNLWIQDFPWIKRFYELKALGQKMTKADWIACGVIEQFQPLLL